MQLMLYVNNEYNWEIMKYSVHYHSPDISNVQAKIFIERLKEIALITELSTRNIICRTISTTEVGVVGQLPSITSMFRTIQRVKTKNEEPPENSLTIHHLVLSDEYIKIHGDNFLKYNNKKENRLLIFATKENLDTLHTFKNWMTDGTFQAVPKLFSQLYTIHGYKNKTTIPLIYVLIINRTTNSYNEILQVLEHNNLNFNPYSISKKMGLQALYAENIEFALQVQHLAALPFVPTNKVILYFEKLVDSTYFVNNENNLSTLVDYFEDTWINHSTPYEDEQSTPTKNMLPLSRGDGFINIKGFDVRERFKSYFNIAASFA
ncbi:hypothetical protein AGLY_017699, partial [Aphis glycines]